MTTPTDRSRLVPWRDDATERLGAPRRIPLFFVLLGVLLAISLAPLAVFGWLTTRGMRDAMYAAQQERQLQTTATVVQRLDAFLDSSGREAVKLGEILGAEGISRRAQQQAFLSELLDETVVMVRFRPARGGRAVTAAVSGFAASSSFEDLLDRDARHLLEQGATTLPASARGALLGGPYALGPDRVLAVTVTAPVQRAGRLLGVLQEVAIFQRAWRQMTAAIPPPGRLFLLAPDGAIVAASGRRAEDTDDAIREREIVREFLGTRTRSPVTRSYAVPGEGRRTRHCLGSFASTRHGWGVFLEVDEDIALAPVNSLISDVLFGGLVAAGLAIGAALALGGFISRPVRRLAAISRRLADGDFSVRAGSSSVWEIHELSGNFNRMAASLGRLVEQFRTAAREANDLFLGTIRALADAIDEKDPYTKGHSVRVNRYSVIIGRYLGLGRDELRALHASSLLHDVGKIGIDDAILKKPAALTDEEFEIMKSHPERGARIMSKIPQMKPFIPGVHLHHERFNGGGYPLGLKGPEIPLQARIIAVADTFDAMTTTRPYQTAFTVQQAVDRINDLRGRALDPQVVEAFNRAYEAGEFDEILASRPDFHAAETPVGT